MRHTLRLIAMLFAAVALVCSAGVADLPVKKLNGQKYYYYKVKKNESLYGISKHLGITRDEIVSHNPASESGVKKGMVLYFPYDVYTPADETPATPAVGAVCSDDQPQQTAATVDENKPATVALMLPFGLDKEEKSKRNDLALDFYKGFLIAADTLAATSGTVEIVAVDTDTDIAALRRKISEIHLPHAAVAVAPDDAAILSLLADSAVTGDAFVLNTFIVADSLYRTNEAVMQANTPQHVMYESAADAFMNFYADCQPVFLRSENGRNEKEPFTAYLASRLREKGIEPLTVTYDGTLLSADFEPVLADLSHDYVVVPSSGSLVEFNKFAYVIHAFRQKLDAQYNQALADMPDTPVNDDIDYEPAAPHRCRLAVFGYPDWTAFRGDARDLLHKLGARIYSRFYDNFNGTQARNIDAAFEHWFGTQITESIPSYALLGFDTGCYILESLKLGHGKFSPSALTTSGVQSTFNFTRCGDAGYYNHAIYIITYNADGTLDFIWL